MFSIVVPTSGKDMLSICPLVREPKSSKNLLGSLVVVDSPRKDAVETNSIERVVNEECRAIGRIPLASFVR